MKTSIIDREDLSFVKAVNQIMFCNPFLPERTELEQKALGADYRVTDRPWNVFIADPVEDANLIALIARVKATVKRCRARLAQRPPASAEEAALYANLVYFHAYYQCRSNFDRFIRAAHASGSAAHAVPFYNASREEAEYYLRAGEHGVPVPYPYEYMFSYGYQIRRAFHHTFQYILGTSPAAMQLRARVWHSIFTHDARRYLRSLVHRMGDIITLITGPSGSGKELIARAIALSRFVALDPKTACFEEDFLATFHPLNLSAMSPTLIESELFGHRKGAFTGALSDHSGHLETCGPQGTVFLDEIGDVALPIQVKLLRVLEARTFHRLGETQPLPFQGKLVAATNRDPATLIQSGELRQDLYYRLCADRVRTVPLTEMLGSRQEDLHYLVRHLAGRVAGEAEADDLAHTVCDWIHTHLGTTYPWPGNVRELEQCVRNIMVHGAYTPEHAATESGLGGAVERGELTADELLSRYAARIYARTRSYEETARILARDSRTVKKLLRRVPNACPPGSISRT